MKELNDWFKSKGLILFSVFAIFLVVGWEIPRLSRDCPKGDICELTGQKIAAIAKVTSLRNERLERAIIEVETLPCPTCLQTGRILVILPHTQYDFQYGDKIYLEGKLKLPVQNSEGNFSYPLYLAGKRIYSVMNYPKIVKIDSFSADAAAEPMPPASPVGRERYGAVEPEFPLKSYQEALYKKILECREQIRRVVNNHLTESDGAVINAMIIGDQGSIPSELRGKLSHAGVIHILSVSGAHITLVIVMITFLLTAVTPRRLTKFLFVIGGVAFYLALSGSPNCASRSAIMGLLVYLAVYRGRNPNFKTALWFSAAILLCLNPTSFFADIGFELSFLAVIGMVYVYPLFEKSFAWGKNGFWWKILRISLLSISISLTTTPLVYFYFGIISWISPLANLILLPLFSLVLPAGFLLVGSGLITGIQHLGFLQEFWKYVTQFLALLIHGLLSFIEYLTDLILKIPGSYSESTIRPGWIILYYILLFLTIFIARFLIKKYIFPRQLDYFGSDKFLNPKTENPWAVFLKKRTKKICRNISEFYASMLVSRIAKIIFLPLLFVASGQLLISAIYLYYSSCPPRLVMLNIGQGDAFLLDWPRYHFQILIDGGPGRNILPELGKIMPFYDRKIEVLVLSHNHQDHIEGLVTLLDRYTVSQAIINSLPQKKIGPVYESSLRNVFWKKLNENKVLIAISKKGQKISLVSKKEKIAELYFLTPFFDYSADTIVDTNDQSIVLKMVYPKNILFMGDSSSKVEKVLLAKESHNIQAEILKIGHHGSRFATSNEFVDAVQPKTALISAGKDNLYGHPASTTIKKLEKKNIRIFRTDVNDRVEILL